MKTGNIGATIHAHNIDEIGIAFDHGGFSISLSPTLSTFEGLAIFESLTSTDQHTFALTGRHSLSADAAGIAQAVVAIDKFNADVNDIFRREEYDQLIQVRHDTETT